MFEMESEIKRLGFFEAAGGAIFLAVITFVLTFIVHLYATVFDPLQILKGLSISAAISSSVFFVGTFVFWLRGGRKNSTVNFGERLELVRSVLSPIEKKAEKMFWSNERRWKCITHVKIEGVAIKVDLHDLDVPTSISVLEVLIAVKDKIGRLKVVTGRGLNSDGKPKIRPAIIKLLQEKQSEHDWDMKLAAGSISLRPIGARKSRKEIIAKTLIYGIPLSIVGYLAFLELSNGSQLGAIIGAFSGIFLAGVLSSN
tara:strand:- start:65 stop:832 length:768 start_codon:yes stop_codon:yes gene_type:complete